MHPIFSCDAVVFDCDGVILDSNSLKVDAMSKALLEWGVSSDVVRECVTSFRENFGKSRAFHLDHFADVILNLGLEDKNRFIDELMLSYGNACVRLYECADLTPGFMELISRLNCPAYVCSGSLESELKQVFQKRNLTSHFKKIYGAPNRKSDVLAEIIEKHGSNILFVGDAMADLEASRVNEIPFIGYLPFSNVPEQLNQACIGYGYEVVNDWDAILGSEGN